MYSVSALLQNVRPPSTLGINGGYRNGLCHVSVAAPSSVRYGRTVPNSDPVVLVDMLCYDATSQRVLQADLILQVGVCEVAWFRILVGPRGESREFPRRHQLPGESGFRCDRRFPREQRVLTAEGGGWAW